MYVLLFKKTNSKDNLMAHPLTFFPFNIRCLEYADKIFLACDNLRDPHYLNYTNRVLI